MVFGLKSLNASHLRPVHRNGFCLDFRQQARKKLISNNFGIDPGHRPPYKHVQQPFSVNKSSEP